MRQSISTINEKSVVSLWREQIQNQRCWSDSEGNPVEILYPGRPNGGRGGDFQDVFIATENGDKRGCIEIHTLSSGWTAHRHHLDPAYNQVVLHVVWENDAEEPTVLENGRFIPTIALKEAIRTKSQPSEPVLSCRNLGRRRSHSSIEEVLSKAGNIRFEWAVSYHMDEGSKKGYEQSLFEGIAEALGYTKNKAAFKKLSGSLPMADLRKIIRVAETEENALLHLQAVLFGKAGLLPSQRKRSFEPDEYTEKITDIWQSNPHAPSMASCEWELFKIRPGNHPVLRLAALSHLLYNWREKGCLDYLTELTRRIPPAKACIHLESAFTVSAGDYWGCHFDFGSPGTGKNRCLSGRSRAAQIVVNVLLPFCCGWGRLNSDPGLSSRALEIYRGYPRLESDAIERHMLEQLSLDRNHMKFALHQQGLMHIYKNYCIQGNCRECPFVA